MVVGRDFVVNNFRWKLTALLLAMLVWFVIKFAIYREMTGGRHQVLRRQTVMVLTAPDDVRLFRLDPPQVDVVVQGTRELTGDDVEVFLDLTTMPDVNTALKQVIVRSVEATKVVRTDPPFVMVERMNPAPEAMTNSLQHP